MAKKKHTRRCTEGTTRVRFADGVEMLVSYEFFHGFAGDRWTPADPGDMNVTSVSRDGRELSERAIDVLLSNDAREARIFEVVSEDAAEIEAARLADAYGDDYDC